MKGVEIIELRELLSNVYLFFGREKEREKSEWLKVIFNSLSTIYYNPDTTYYNKHNCSILTKRY